MAELQTKEAIMERITVLQRDLDTLLMSAEKEYRTRFEISDLKYTLLQREVDELKQVVQTQEGRIQRYEQAKKTRSEHESREKPNEGFNKQLNAKFRKQIEHLEFKLQTEVHSTDKERELIETIKRLKHILQENEGPGTGEENPAHYRKNSW